MNTSVSGDVASDGTDIEIDGTEENGAGGDTKSGIDEKILGELEGVYICSEYIEKFKETKSIESVYKLTPVLYFHKSADGYTVMPGDFHQGSKELPVISVDELESGRYSVRTDSDEYMGECEIIYTPGETTVECVVNSEIEALSTGGEMKSFIHFKSGEEFSRVMSEIVFEGADGVEISGDEVYVDINGERWLLDFANDYTGIASDGIDMSSYDGAFFAKNAGDGESDFLMYKYDVSAVTLFDTDGNEVAVLKK